jgi:hypothetical protein
MKKLTANDPETRSADILADNIEQLKALLPEAFTEGKIDFDVLKQLLAARWTTAKKNTASIGTANVAHASLLSLLPPAH